MEGVDRPPGEGGSESCEASETAAGSPLGGCCTAASGRAVATSLGGWGLAAASLSGPAPSSGSSRRCRSCRCLAGRSFLPERFSRGLEPSSAGGHEGAGWVTGWVEAVGWVSGLEACGCRWRGGLLSVSGPWESSVSEGCLRPRPP